MTDDRPVLRYQQRCFREYARSVGLSEVYTYPDGNPIRPLPPVQTATRGLMVVGAYPSARFESRLSRLKPPRRRLVPVADNLQPFGYEQYFDGQRVRTLESADGLDRCFLSPLGLSCKDAWVTDLVKVFLYKPEHADSCGDACPDFQVPVLRGRFRELAIRGLPWLEEECRLCQPKLVVTLGEEVAQVVSGELNAPADDLLSRDVSRTSRVGDWPVLFLPHPDACRRSQKWRERMSERVAMVKTLGISERPS